MTKRERSTRATRGLRKTDQSRRASEAKTASGRFGHGALDRESGPQLGRDFRQSTFERHAALLGEPRLLHPANAGVKAQIVRRLQSDYGNRYVQSLVDHVRSAKSAPGMMSGLSRDADPQYARRVPGSEGLTLQTKLTVGPVGDKYETEADNVAKQIVGGISPGPSGAQRQVTSEEEVQRDSLQRQPLEEEEVIQTKSAERQIGVEGGEVDRDSQRSIEAARGHGEKLPNDMKASMEGAFGVDFGGVRLHRNSEADDLNNTIGSRAFTSGEDIFIRKGEQPAGSPSGQELLAHELTHVVQQAGGRAPGAGPDISESPQRLVVQRTPEAVWNLPNAAMSTDDARIILKRDFFSNWFVAKDYLLKKEKWTKLGKDDQEISAKKSMLQEIMKVFLKLRQQETDSLLEQIRDDELNNDAFGGLTPDERLSWSAAGSETLTSDIDVNLKGAGSIAAVTLFNKLFKDNLGWPYEPGTVYDVNVYAQDFMEKKPFSKQEKGGKITLVPNQEVELEGEAFATFSANQDVWSLVKMRRYMTDGEWSQYKQTMVGDGYGPTDPEARYQEGMDMDVWVRQQQLREQFADAEYYQDVYQASLEKQLAEIESSTEPVYKTMRDNLAMAQGYMSKHQAADTKNMIAANLIYQEKLEEVTAIRLRLKELKEDPQSSESEIKADSIRLKNALSFAIVYANEAYLTQGGVHFSVIGQQIGGGIQKKTGKEVGLDLSDQEYLHSFREQIGDTLKVMSERKDGPLWAAAYDAGKYIDRMSKSAAPLIGGAMVKWAIVLSNIGDTAMYLKGRGADDATKQHHLVPLVDQIAGDVAGFRAAIVKFGAEVEKAYNMLKHTGPIAKEGQELGNIAVREADKENPVGRQLQQGIQQAQKNFPKIAALIAKFEAM